MRPMSMMDHLRQADSQALGSIRNLGPWTGSKEGEVQRLRLPYRTMLTEQGVMIVYAHISKLNLEAPTGPPVLRGSGLQGQRRGGSARRGEKESVLAMRWAGGGQSTRPPISGPRRAFRVRCPP